MLVGLHTYIHTYRHSHTYHIYSSLEEEGVEVQAYIHLTPLQHQAICENLKLCRQQGLSTASYVSYIVRGEVDSLKRQYWQTDEWTHALKLDRLGRGWV